MQNSGNSCYISSVLFALWHRGSKGFDGLLVQTLAEGDDEEQRQGQPHRGIGGVDSTAAQRREMQIHIRDAIINPLRRGELVEGHNMEILRRMATECGWMSGRPRPDKKLIAALVDMGFEPARAIVALHEADCDVQRAAEILSGPARTARHRPQCDAAEFLLFLLEVMHAPRIPLVQRIFHGGDDQAGEQDCRFITGRALQVSLGEDSSSSSSSSHGRGFWAFFGGGAPAGGKGKPLRLTELLWHHFFDNKLSGIERWVGGQDGGSERVVGLEHLKLSPFYTFQSEDGSHTGAKQASLFQNVMVPIVLDRYRFRSQQRGRQSAKDAREVRVPTSIDFTEYVALSGDDDLAEYRLKLISMIIHIGERCDSGHYIAIGRDEGAFGGEGGWALHDDLKLLLRPLRCFRTLQAAEDAGVPITGGAYVLIYELQNTTEHMTDAEVAGMLHARYASVGSARMKNLQQEQGQQQQQQQQPHGAAHQSSSAAGVASRPHPGGDCAVS